MPAFKEYYNQELLEQLAASLTAVYPAFPGQAFVHETAPQLAALELKGRVAAIAAALRRHLPPAYPAALAILVQILGPEHSESEGMFTDGWYLMPVAAFVEYYGLDHPQESLAALNAITRRHTAEFAVRPFIERYPEQTLAVLEQWAADPSFHLRRLVSEGTRTRLPWAARLPRFIDDPAPVLALLERLKDDPVEYVRRSVANNLNDLAKDHPDLVLATLERWSHNAGIERRRIIRHALRSLVKQGHPTALRLLGAEAPLVELEYFSLSPASLPIGASLSLELALRNHAGEPQHLVIDYVMHLAGANGRPRRKVFKLRSQKLAPGERLQLRKSHSFAVVSVRRYYPGPQRIDLQVNGLVLAGADFELTP